MPTYAPDTSGTGDSNDLNEITRQALLKRLSGAQQGAQPAAAQDDSPQGQGLLNTPSEAARAAYMKQNPSYGQQLNQFNMNMNQDSSPMSKALKNRKVAPQTYPATEDSEPRSTNNDDK